MSIHNENYSANSTELPRVAVLMSTYNGEIFIREQIESILAQEDDGSSDQTFEILKEYEDAGNLKILPAKKNVGPGRRFMTLIFAVSKRTDFDYMAFADQDDIWLPSVFSPLASWFVPL